MKDGRKMFIAARLTPAAAATNNCDGCDHGLELAEADLGVLFELRTGYRVALCRSCIADLIEACK